jgi:hypothetical protein
MDGPQPPQHSYSAPPAEIADVYLAARHLPDGRSLFVYPLTFGRARLGIGPRDDGAFDDVW